MRQRVRSATIAVTGRWLRDRGTGATARRGGRRRQALHALEWNGERSARRRGDAAARAARASSRLRWPAASVASWGTMARLKRSVRPRRCSDERVDEALVDLVAEAVPHEPADRVTVEPPRQHRLDHQPRALPRTLSNRVATSARTSAGTPRSRPSGMECSRPCHTKADVLAGEVSALSSPTRGRARWRGVPA